MGGRWPKSSLNECLIALLSPLPYLPCRCCKQFARNGREGRRGSSFPFATPLVRSSLHSSLTSSHLTASHRDVVPNFPLLSHAWSIFSFPIPFFPFSLFTISPPPPLTRSDEMGGDKRGETGQFVVDGGKTVPSCPSRLSWTVTFRYVWPAWGRPSLPWQVRSETWIELKARVNNTHSVDGINNSRYRRPARPIRR